VLNYLPYLDAGAMNATVGGKNFLTWFNKTNPGQPIDLYAIYGWISAQLLTQAMIAAG
jgi:hypothetical protein